ncbi:Acetylcholine receptor subunit alpha-like 2 [Eumeta japonica]|uniref:Acetylcholine receptor subunit alpha-like 2 n=1 Tax=Eumeta variegata TaxID=151549 RepID=A0A4C1VVG6_EUMVA|nr:Acetylcholine receptor subunit alpha-like 2 [Eumeta japonica]
MGLKILVIFAACSCGPALANPDAKRLYDDLLSNYNRLIRPVYFNNMTVLVKLGLRLSQLIDLMIVKRRNVGVVLHNQVFPNSFSPEPLHADEHYHVEE